MAPRRAALALGLLGALYAVAGRRRVVTWGATAGEACAHLPGDDLLDAPDAVTTRAITIAAPPSDVWPWLAQMGPSPRGGVYTYDWIENLLGLDIHSVDRVLPEFQSPQIGDEIAFGPNLMRIASLETGRSLVWRSGDENWVWAFALVGDDEGTRLISRNSFRLPTTAARIGLLPMEPASLVMERRMLTGIRQRAERLAAGRC